MSENKRSKTETVNSLQEALLNLEAAKNSGVITEKEYRAKRESILSIPKSRLLWKGIWWKVPVGIVSLIMLLDALDKASSDGKSHRAAIAHTLPSCDSDDAKKQFRML